ncbi:uncharacterized protein [Nicotiana tomentosiformis]|uniref:uncharacterized protein n=1 Tax=Nicotiana tomentosiformis TaxID=4098 RepID=UPI00388CAAC0
MCTSLSQAVSVPSAAATSQDGGGTQTPVSRTPEQVMQGLQTPGALPAQPVAAAQAHEVYAMTDDEHQTLKRFGRFHPPSFSGTEAEDAQGFLDKWWEAYERRMPVGATPLTWQEFSVLFLEKFVPQSHREELRKQERVSGATFDEVVDIARQIEMIRSQERGERKAKRPRGSGGFSGVPPGVHRGASSGHGPYSTHQGQSSISALPAQSSSHALSAHGSSISGPSSNYLGARGSLQSLPPFTGRGCFECGDLGHIKRHYPRLSGGSAQQRSQPTTSAPITSPYTRPARGGAQSAKGFPRRGGQSGGGQA